VTRVNQKSRNQGINEIQSNQDQASGSENGLKKGGKGSKR